MNKHCIKCDEDGHTEHNCRKAIKNYKYYRKWARTRKSWKKHNPPNHQGYYICYICGKWVNEEEVTLDHIIPRSRDPKLRYRFDNIQPCCLKCNTQKGSQVYE